MNARLKAWWFKVLRNESVRSFISPYCVVWLLFAVPATFVLPPIKTFSDIMGMDGYLFWVWAAIPANAAPIVGLAMRHGGQNITDMSVRLLFRDWMGLIMQILGHSVCFLLLVWFEVTAWIAVLTYEGPNEWAGVTYFCAIMLIAWTGGVFILCAQCVAKVKRGIEIEVNGGVM
jgi:hypothetical protein